MNSKNKSLSKFELIILFLIVCVLAFLALPIFNSYRFYQKFHQSPSTNPPLKEWNREIENNDSDIPVLILPDNQ
jgi:cell division protein FtsL